ncbi:MAG: 3'(2'),5'-bisphosphate nucleotidase CysQ [Caulobacteraceae bacterium]
MTELDRTALLEGVVEAALRAGRAILDIYQSDFAVQVKPDASPVTEADTAAEAIILAALARLAPGVPVVAEEEVAAGRTPQVGEMFFLVDPLDGTKEFVQRRGDFTVNVALIEQGRPTLGVVYPPVRGRLYAADVRAGAAWAADVSDDRLGARTPLRVRTPGEAYVVVASKSHPTPGTETYLSDCEVESRISVGSSLKFCLVAAGEADLYPRPSPTSEWDTAAGHAVLAAAGGAVFGPDGTPLVYGKPGFFNPGFVACGPFTPKPIGPFIG